MAELHSHTIVVDTTDNSKDCNQEDMVLLLEAGLQAYTKDMHLVDTLHLQGASMVPICKVYKSFEHQFKFTATIRTDVTAV